SYEQMEEVKTFAERIASPLGLTFDPSSADSPEPSSTTFHFQGEQQQVDLQLRVIAIPNQAQWDTYVTVNMSADPAQRDGLRQQLEAVYEVLGNENIVPQFNACTQGFINDKLTNDNQ